MKTHLNKNGTASCGAISDTLLSDKSKVGCFACHDTWEFSFVNTLGKRETHPLENVLSIHSPVSDPDGQSGSLIKIDSDEGAYYTGSYMIAKELINKFNRKAPEDQQLIEWEYNKFMRYNATKKDDPQYIQHLEAIT